MRAALPLSLLSLACLARFAAGQEMTGFDRQRAHLMLRVVERDLRDYYYDSTFHGLDLKTLFDSADARIAAAKVNGEAFLAIAVTLAALRDSHTQFYPPRRAAQVQYGWNLGIVGDSSYIIRVGPESDAAAKGVKPGDRVIGIDRFAVTREDWRDVEYLYYALAPRAAVQLALQSPGDTVRSVVVRAKVTQHPPIMDLTHGDDIWQIIRQQQNVEQTLRSRFWEFGSDVLVWKLPIFVANDREIDESVRRAQGFKALVIDLRGDPGGLESTLLRLAGNLVGADTFGVRRERTKTEPLRTRTGGPQFTGTVVAVVDAQSMSAAELLAYFLQMRKRGVVVGDRTAGAVMESRGHEHRVGVDVVAFYYTSVTQADLVFADGTRLEGRGVIPDEVVLPTGADLAAHRDPALARAIGLAGRRVTPEEAGSLFPVEW
ncbi:MAG TPA: S41 family peptidase [Gemmatimonadales bacterium]|nr:S41 family peptidase [Gemmatimonadales bacterium]